MAAEIPSFSKLIPGFDFLQDLAKGAGLGVPGMGAGGASGAMPGFGQWVAPTLNPEELGKRIDELKTVQFWLESNAKVLAATIQALEVQRMTLSTLKTMNVQMGDLRDSMMASVPDALKPKTPTTPPASSPAPAPATDDDPGLDPGKTGGPKTQKTGQPDGGNAMKPPVPVVDPMQWWTALTQQFTQLATTALKDAPAEAAKAMAGVDLSAFQMPGAAANKAKPAAVPAPAAKTPALKKAAAKTSAKPAVKAARRATAKAGR